MRTARQIRQQVIIGIVLAFVLVAGGNASVELKSSVFETELQAVRYQQSVAAVGEFDEITVGDDAGDGLTDTREMVKPKSATKAFLLSLAVPGLGQYYYGSRVKPFAFLAVEALAWGMNIKLNNDADDITAEFEAYNRAHWSQSDYETYLLWTYGKGDDDSLGWVQAISHHIPDTRTQQYYEMTGKYDQFAWGWDDAVYQGNHLTDYDNSDNPPPPLDVGTAYSARRMAYEQRRHDANEKYDQAKKMVYVAMVNHLFSAFEAYFVTKSLNAKIPSGKQAFSRLNVRADLRSFYTKQDTPYMRVSYKF